MVDTGATDNFIRADLAREFHLPVDMGSQGERVSMGSKDAEAKTEGETHPLTISCGPHCKVTTRMTLLDLGDYDIILGRPFQIYTQAAIHNRDCLIKTPRGWQALPLWIDTDRPTPRLMKLSLSHMLREQRHHQGESYILYPKTPINLSSQQGTVAEFSRGEHLQRTPILKHRPPNTPWKPSGDCPTRSQPPKQVRISPQKHLHLTRGHLPDAHKDENIDQHIRANKETQEEDPIAKIPRASGIPELERLLKEYKEVFPADLPLTLPPDREFTMNVPIKPGSTPPCQAPYRVSSEALEIVKQTLEYLETHGFIRESTSEYAAPVCLTPKPDGTWRFCIDYRKLNSICVEAKYPLPRIEDCMDKLGKAQYFSKIDLRSGYWQLKVNPQDAHKTAFRTQYGQYEWLVVPMGLQGAPSAFQRMMNHYLRGFLGKFVQVYLDDILIYSQTQEEHLDHIRQVLQVLKDKKLYAKGTKCDFFRQHVEFLGYRVSQGKIFTHPKKIQAIQEWPLPTNVREVRSFLGLCNFYRKFIQNHAKIAKPLTDVLKSTDFEAKYGTPFKKTAPVQLGEKEIKAFQELKDALTQAPCLVIFDPTKPTEVWADASWDNSTIGAVLMQDHGKGLQPVAFLSKVMNAAESRYPTFEQELLALKKAFVEWRHYLLPITFTARTDHNGLKYLKTQPHLSERQWHWLALFSEYHFELAYRPGKQMVVPDSLSRRPNTTEDITELLREEEEDAVFQIPVRNAEGQVQKVLLQKKGRSPPMPMTQIPPTLEYEGDPDYGDIYQKLSQDPTPQGQPSLDLYYIDDKHNLIWKDKRDSHRICVPKKYRALLLQEHHDTPLGGHFGMEKTYHSMKDRYMWPSMRHHIEQYVLSCEACQKNKTYHKRGLGTPQLLNAPMQPWQHLSIDFCGPFPKTKKGQDYIMAVIDNLTREVFLLPCQQTITAQQASQLFMDRVFPRTGLPEKINSDRGPQFVSNFWTHLWEKLRTKTALSAPYHPQSNSLVERQNKTFIENLRSFVNARQNDWEECLPLYEFAYNSSVNPTTGETPFFLNHGRHPRTPVALTLTTPSPVVEDFVETLQNRLTEARDHILRSQAQTADQRAKKLQPAELAPGDLVLLSTEHYNLMLPSKKLTPRYIGPLKVLQVRGPNTVLIEVPPRLKGIEPIQNVAHLKKYHLRPPEVGPQIAPLPPDIIDDKEEFEIEDIIAHRGAGKKTQYLVRFKSYGPEDDLWLPAANLHNAQDIVQGYHQRQEGKEETKRTTRASTTRRLQRLGHLWIARDCNGASRGECDITASLRPQTLPD